MRTSSFVFLLIASIGFVGCGGSSTTATTSNASTSAAGWTDLEGTRLPEYVKHEAETRIVAAPVSLDLQAVYANLETPANAPELGGRAVEYLIDIASAEAALGNSARAEKIVRLIRARAKNRNLAFAANTLLAEVSRRQAEAAQQPAAIERVMTELPSSRLGASTVVFQLFQTQEQLDGRVAQAKEQLPSLETARSVLFYRDILPEIVRNRTMFLAAIDAVRTRATAEQPLYAFSTVDLTTATDAQPVVVAVWDTGTNTELFAAQKFVNAGEQSNGTDDDGNGQVDDVSGIVSDATSPNTALVYQPAEAILTTYKPYLKGVMDLRAGLASTPDAQRVLELVRAATTAEALEELETNLGHVGEWAHGTHVAGIMLSGVPQAKLVVFRSAWAGEARTYHHRGPTDAELAAERANVDAIAEFVRRHHVKVVNASLGFTKEYLAAELRHESATYPNEEAVQARVAVVHAQRRATWEAIFDACPETLFVVAAGNDNHDVVEYEDVSGSITRPNVVIVGAVDKYGSWATFTNSNPQNVRVFDHGVEVDSFIPSGERIPLSGTSMASPNVANLAAKMFAVDPALTPTRAAAIIEETAEPIAAPFNGRIAHEERALTLVRRERDARTAPATPTVGGRTRRTRAR